MTPKEKAKELMEKFKPHVIFTLTDGTISEHIKSESAKQCALIAVDELIEVGSNISTDYSSGVGYWQKVKEEIIKI